MPKKNTIKTISIAGIAILFIAFFIFALIFGSKYFTKQTGFGGQVLSLQQADFTSIDSLINGKAWLLTIVQNDFSQYVTGEFSTEAINQKLNTKEKVKYPLKVTLSSSPQKCLYKLNAQSSSNDIYTIEAKRKTSGSTFGENFFTRESCFKACGLQGSGGYFSSNDFQCEGNACATCKVVPPLGKFEAYCYAKSSIATFGEVDLDKLSFNSEVIATINNQEYRGKLSNENRNPVSLGDGRIYANWAGSLVSGINCPSPSGQDIASAYNGNTARWILISRLNYINYKNYDSNGFGSCLSNYLKGTLTPQDCASKYNSASNLALSPKEFVAVGGTSKTQPSGTKNDGKYEIELGEAINFPVIVMRIKADLLGIVIPTSQPKIVEQDSECFTTGSNGFITATIKNVGDDDATFFVSVNCPVPFSQTGNAVSVQLAPNTQQLVNIPITGQGNSEIKKQCVITSVDSENPAKKDTADVTTCVKPIIRCGSGETKCNGVVREKCNAEGSGWSVIEGDTTCKTTGGGEACKHTLQIGSAVLIPNLKCFSIFKTILWIATILIGLFALFIMYSFTTQKSTNQALNWIISIAFGIGAGVLVFLLFWWGILLFILLIIIRAVIPFKIYKRVTKNFK